MKRFNEVIQIEVDVDSIANSLLDHFKEDYKHREIVTETIVGRLLTKGGLSLLYNSINGYSPEINFQVGETVMIENYRYNYLDVDLTIHDNYPNKTFTFGVITKIDVYSDEKLTVEYYTVNRGQKGYKLNKEERLFRHTSCYRNSEDVEILKQRVQEVIDLKNNDNLTLAAAE